MADVAPGVKVCGIQRMEDALLAAALGASAIGFIFWAGSPRFIDPVRARVIADALPADVLRVGVFVDHALEYVQDVAGRAALGAIQLHGSESAADYAGLGLPVIQAIGVTDPFDASVIDAVPGDVTVLLDAHDPVRRGGTGRTIDWSIAAAMSARRRTILSGGLNAENVSEAIERVRPYMVDVSSGVESAPGIKDAAKLRSFFEALAHRANDRTNQNSD